MFAGKSSWRNTNSSTAMEDIEVTKVRNVEQEAELSRKDVNEAKRTAASRQ